MYSDNTRTTMLSVASVILITAMTISSVDRAASYEYMVIVPRLVWPKSILRIPVHFSKPVQNETVTAELLQIIENRRTRDTESLDKQTIYVPDGDTQTEITLQAPINISWGFYEVNIFATGSIEFRNSSSLYGRPKANAIFVQTDKKTYKPGDTVHYRVFVVDSKLNLAAPGFNVEIKDPKGNKLKEITNQNNYFGIDDSIDLSSTPPLGSWRIVVKILDTDEVEHYMFEVKEYVLPKFEVIINLPPFGCLSDKELTGSVSAKYTFGKDVNGTIILTSSRRYGAGFFDPAAVRTEMPINGKTLFSIPMNLLERVVHKIMHNAVIVHASVTETVTGVTVENQAVIRFHTDSFTVRFHPSMPSYFRPEFNPYKVLIKVQQKYGRPPQNTKEKLKVTVSYFTDSEVIDQPQDAVTFVNYTIISPFTGGGVILKNTNKYPLDMDGIVMFDLNIPEKASTMSIKAEYKNSEEIKNVQKFRTMGNISLNTELVGGDNRSLEIGDTVTFKVTVTEGPITANYLVIAHGTAVKAGDVNISGPALQGFVEVTITRAMTNLAKFVVYYVTPDGEIIADGLNFAVEEIFENKVQISFNELSPQEPKSSVTLRVTADPDSVVNVLAVDKSVKRLGHGNDIDEQRVKSVMSKFDETPRIPSISWGGSITKSSPMEADDSYDIFREAQLNVLTDSHLHKFELWRLDRESYNGKSVTPGGSGDDLLKHTPCEDVLNEIDRSTSEQSRKYFPETWMWKSATAENGVAYFDDVIPDTITEFVASAFVLNNKTGLGMARTTASMTAFLPFFVNLQLPYSVVRNEIVVVQVNVFNYREKDCRVNVVLRKSKYFVAITAADYGLEKEVPGDITKCVTAKVNRTTPVFFSIKPTKIGNIALTVRATIQPPINIYDEIVKHLPVMAKGIPQEKNNPNLIVLKTEGTKNVKIPIQNPKELVNDSARIRVTISGDIFGPSLQNLDELIKIPSGCGEQNMVHFAPMIFAVNYMNKTGRLDNNTDLIQTITRALQLGYQRQLTYQRWDGSFSPFADSDKEGSVWLTTFVIKSFAQAHSLGLIYIDPKVVDRAVKFISRNQDGDGFMEDTGFVHRKAPREGSSAVRRTLSTFVLTSLQELKKSEMSVDPTTISSINDISMKLTSALVSSFVSMEDDYELATTAYALKLVREPTYKKLLQALEKSETKVKGNDMMFWNTTNKAMEIETASYALLAYSLRKTNLKNARMITNWLITQRNPNGGFQSTQDTVVALQGLSEFASLIYSKEVNLKIDVRVKNDTKILANQNVKLTSDNHDVLQYMEFPHGDIDEVEMQTNGTGLALIDIIQYYNIESESASAYNITAEVLDETVYRYKLHVCASYLYGRSNESSNMAIMDIGVVSGFEPEKDLVEMKPYMRRLEMYNGHLIIYFVEIPRSGLCVIVPMQRTSRVANVKPSSVVVYSYYEPSERATVTYIPDILRQRSLCSTCPECCSSLLNCKTTKKRRLRKRSNNV